MINEARKRDHLANAVLALSFVANAAQSKEHLVQSGKIESTGMAAMSRTMETRRKANKNLDSPRVSEPARNRKKKTFEEFVAEARQQTFSSRADLERHYGGVPKGMVANNAASSENPKWRLVTAANRKAQAQRRADAIKSLNTDDEREAAKRKSQRAARMGYEVHHITPIHHSAKLKSSMSDAEWEQRKAEDAKDGIYHGHHPKNIMHTKGKNTPENAPGVPHRAGGAHEIEGKVKDIVTNSKISYRDLLAAAIKKKRQAARKNK
jgi:hypothetical protein